MRAVVLSPFPYLNKIMENNEVLERQYSIRHASDGGDVFSSFVYQ